MKSLVQTAIGFCIVGALLAGSASASVIVGGTRVVYPLDQREVTVRLENDSKNPSLVQVWMDDGNADAKPGETKVPFLITPPIFRMEPRKTQMLRVIFSGDTSLPQDRESVYWLNVLDIPPKAEPKSDANSLQFAFRTRIKVFVRPQKLPGSPEDAPRQLEWKLVPAPQGKGQALSVSNPTPYYVSFSEIDVVEGSQSWKNETGGMVPPRGTAVIAVPKMQNVSGKATVRFTAINDFGGAMPGDAPLRP
ncbi:MAG TPA: fimbria/pilus periplasmic chaperone [Paraburkholderia sp.]|jgi:chaperone protein EcpD|nr:fimbria/pilus periplasmic chaperone [Paraburkholderia sp.]